MMQEWYAGRAEELSYLKRRKGWKSFLFMLSFFLFAVAAGAATIYWVIEGKPLPFNRAIDTNTASDPLLVSVASPRTVNSGSSIDIVVTYQNTSKVRLIDLQMQMFFPANFLFVRSTPAEPYNTQKNYWRLPALEPRESSKVVITGQVVGASLEKKSVEAVVLYKPTNFHSTFKKTASTEFAISKSVLDLAIVGPDTLLPTQEISYTIEVKNTADIALENIVVRLSFSEHIQITSSLPKVEEGVWFVQRLEPGETSKLTISGELKARGGDLITIKAEAGIREEGEIVLQNYRAVLAPVISPDVSLVIERVDSGVPLRFGTALQAEARINNLSSLDLENPTLELVISDRQDVLEEKSFTVGAPYTREIIDEKKDSLGEKMAVRVSNLSPIGSGEEASIPFTVEIIDVPYDIGALEYIVEVTPRLKAESPDVSVPIEIVGSRAAFRIERD